MTVNWLKRVLGECREDVGEEQLLVLLLMVDAKLDEFEGGAWERRESSAQRLIDVAPVLADLGRACRTPSVS